MPRPIFQRFNALPPELRHQIWVHALPSAAVIEFEFCPSAAQWFCPLKSLPPSCGLLGACIESRDLFLKHYETKLEAFEVQKCSRRSFLCNHNFDGRRGAVPRRLVYMDLTIDTVYIGPNSQNELGFTKLSISCLLEIPTMENLRHLAVEGAEWSNEITHDAGEFGSLRMYEKLEMLTVAIEDLDWAPVFARFNPGSVENFVVIKMIDFPDTMWYEFAAKNIEMLWKERLEAFEGDVTFELSVKKILRDSKS